MPKTDTLAANHGQNRSRGRAVRWDSEMISMPVVSTPSRRGCSRPDPVVAVWLMAASSRTVAAGTSTGPVPSGEERLTDVLPRRDARRHGEEGGARELEVLHERVALRHRQLQRHEVGVGVADVGD